MYVTKLSRQGIPTAIMTHSNCDYDQGGVHGPLPFPAELVATIDSGSQGGSLSPVVYLSWAHQNPKDSSQAMVQLGGYRNKIAKKKTWI